jgi:hypothetical protein
MSTDAMTVTTVESAVDPLETACTSEEAGLESAKQVS